jgi:predicted Zn-dependent protease
MPSARIGGSWNEGPPMQRFLPRRSDSPSSVDPGSRRWTERLSWLLLLGVWGVIAVSTISERLHQPPPRVLPPAVHPAVLIVPIGDFRPRDLDRYSSDYRSEYGLEVQIGDPIPLDPRAWDATRRQYVAEDLIASLRSAHPESAIGGTIVMGMTSADIYIRGLPWNWAFALRDGSQFTVLSSARISKHGKYDDPAWRFRKLVTREIGFLCFALPPTDDPYDLLYADVKSEADLRRMSPHL